MKRFYAFLCLCALLCTLCACKTEEKQDPSVSVFTTEGTAESVQTTSPTETTEPTTEATEPTTTEVVMPPEIDSDQIRLIARERETWIPAEEWYYQSYNYAVTDLNQNGRLEILVSICQGSGIFTTTDVYEVSEDGESLIHCASSLGEGGSQADLIMEKTPVYYNEETGVYTYLFTDAMRSGYAWNGEEARAVTLTEGVLVDEMIAGISNEWDEQGNGTTTYYNAAGEEIDEAAYQAAIADYFSGCVEMEAQFAWLMYSYEEAVSMETEVWEIILQISYEGFSLN